MQIPKSSVELNSNFVILKHVDCIWWFTGGFTRISTNCTIIAIRGEILSYKKNGISSIFGKSKCCYLLVHTQLKFASPTLIAITSSWRLISIFFWIRLRILLLFMYLLFSNIHNLTMKKEKEEKIFSYCHKMCILKFLWLSGMKNINSIHLSFWYFDTLYVQEFLHLIMWTVYDLRVCFSKVENLIEKKKLRSFIYYLYITSSFREALFSELEKILWYNKKKRQYKS